LCPECEGRLAQKLHWVPLTRDWLSLPRRTVAAGGWGVSELQKLERIQQQRPWQQQRRWLVLRDLAKSRSFPNVLITVAILVYAVIAWQWL